jgi:hypothetical protein
MEKQSYTSNDEEKEPAATSTDQDNKEKPPEDPNSPDSTSKPATANADRPANEQPSEEPSSSGSTTKAVDTKTEQTVKGTSSEEHASGDSVKNPAAVSLGRLGGLKGGKARAKSLTKRERSDAARKAARARWRKKEQAK